jgi:hypothetical protein
MVVLCMVLINQAKPAIQIESNVMAIIMSFTKSFQRTEVICATCQEKILLNKR